jgi:hypothetical protein
MRAVIGIAAKQLARKSTMEWLDVLRGPARLPVRRQRP